MHLIEIGSSDFLSPLKFKECSVHSSVWIREYTKHISASSSMQSTILSCGIGHFLLWSWIYFKMSIGKWWPVGWPPLCRDQGFSASRGQQFEMKDVFLKLSCCLSHCRRLSWIFGLCPLDANQQHTPPFWMVIIKNVSRVCKICSGNRIGGESITTN